MRKHNKIEAGHSAFTASSYFNEKLEIRKRACQSLDRVDVLDLYAGKHVIWNQISHNRYYGVDNYEKSGNLPIDNRTAIKFLDLGQFTVIDADAYGMPYEQIQLLYENKTLRPGTVVCYTCITGPMNRLCVRLLQDFAIEREYKRTRTLFNRYGYQYFHEMLNGHGVKDLHNIIIKKSMRKEYGYFIV